MALKVTRSNGVSFSARFSLSASTTCQEIASPSRSGSVARISFSAPFEGLGDVGDALAALRVDLPEHPEIVVRVDRAVLCRQIADVAEGGQDLVVAAEIFVDRLRLRGRFDDEHLHSGSEGGDAGQRWQKGERGPAAQAVAEAFKWASGAGKSNFGPGAGARRRRHRSASSSASWRIMAHHRRAIAASSSGQSPRQDRRPFAWGQPGRSCPHEPLRALPAPATDPIAVASAWPPRARSTRIATCSGSRAFPRAISTLARPC